MIDYDFFLFRLEEEVTEEKSIKMNKVKPVSILFSMSCQKIINQNS